MIHLVSPQNLQKNYHFLPPDAHTSICISGVQNISFLGKFYVRTKWINPFTIHSKLSKVTAAVLKLKFHNSNAA